MRTRKMDESGDYVFGNGRDDYLVDSPEAVAQRVMTRLALPTGSWFTDLEDGTPYSTQILGERTRPLYDIAIRKRILGTNGVLSIVNYSSEFEPDKRRLSVNAIIQTIYGQATVTGVL